MRCLLVPLVLVTLLVAGCAPPPPHPVEYVDKKDWQPAPQVSAMEAAKNQVDAGLTEPAPMSLTKHKPVPETTHMRGRRKR